MRFSFAAAGILGLIATPAMAASQVQSCMSAAQADAVWLTFLPTALDSLSARCGPSLAPSAYLNAQARQTAERFRAEARGSEADVGNALKVMLADKDGVTGEMSSDVLTSFATEIVRGMVKSKVELKDCQRANDVIELAAPMPPRNLAKLITLLMRSDKDKSPFRICPDSGAR